jgi:hypothetical protein
MRDTRLHNDCDGGFCVACAEDEKRAKEAKHPREYGIVNYDGYHIMVVDAGTKVTDERSGQEIEVTDLVSAKKGDVIFCTQDFFDFMRAHTALECGSVRGMRGVS